MLFTPSPESVLHLPAQYLCSHYLLGQEFLPCLPPSVKIISILQDLCQISSPLLWPFEPKAVLFPLNPHYCLYTQTALGMNYLGLFSLVSASASLSPSRHRMSFLSQNTTQGADSGRYSTEDWPLKHSPFILLHESLQSPELSSFWFLKQPLR